MKICQDNPNSVRIGQKSLELYVKFEVSFIIAGKLHRHKRTVFEWCGIRLSGEPKRHEHYAKAPQLTLCAHCLSCLICCGLLVDIIFRPILTCFERYVRTRQLKYKVQLEIILLPTFLSWPFVLDGKHFPGSVYSLVFDRAIRLN
jgi:hypothetical protein